MRVGCVLDEAIQQNGHLIALELVLRHYLKQLISPILEEEHFSLKRVGVQQLVAYLG
jgi:hypothetical protein